MNRSRLFFAFALLVVVAPRVSAQGPTKAATTQEIWNAAQLQGAHAGYVHTRVSQIHHQDQLLIRTVTELNLTIRRNGRVVQLRMDTGSEETAEGKVTSVFMKQYQGNQPQLVMTGEVQQGELTLRINGATRNIPWNDKVLGLYRQEHLFQDRPAKPGNTFSYLSFEPTLANVVRNRVVVKEYEKVHIPGKGSVRLLRVESMPDKIDVPGGEVQLPGLVSWLDANGVTQISEFELPQLGTLVLYRTSEAVARSPTRPGPEIIQGIPINRAIQNANDVARAVYRITVKSDKKAATTFATDNRQIARKANGDLFELEVRAYPQPNLAAAEVKSDPEFLKSCYFIDSDDPRVRALAEAATAGQMEPWSKALRIETWVHDHMRVNSTDSFAPASKVAANLQGDCRQHALLAAAMCRAVGVPARTAIGLCYANDRKLGPAMAFHMWTEVWVGGQWVGIDATRGQGHVGATHLKITDSSWSNTQSLAPLLPVIRVLGKLSIEVESVD
jgi:transglutaminase-like putative cysteine protease